MPLYTYKCPEHGEFDLFMDMHSIPKHPCTPCAACGMESSRVFNSVGKGIIRPSGWSLRPGEPGYSNLPRESERFAQEWQQQQRDALV
jgi:putative FmdB family regulatory protein